MIQSGDLARPARVQVQDGEERDWRRPWRKRPKFRTVFLGYIEKMDSGSMRGGGVRVEMVDALSRLSRQQYNAF